MLAAQLGPERAKPARKAIKPTSTPLLLLLALFWPKLAPNFQDSVRGQEVADFGQLSGCDLLLNNAPNDGNSNNNNIAQSPLANYCQCKDVESNGELLLNAGSMLSDPTVTPTSSASQTSSTSRENLARINQLNCSPTNLTQFIKDLLEEFMLPESRNKTLTKFQVDYLSVNTNIITQAGNINHTLSLLEGSSGRNQLFVDYLSLQLNLPCLYEPKDCGQLQTNYDDRVEDEQSIAEPGQVSYLALTEQQMIDFGSVVNGAHLKSLSVRFTPTNQEDGQERETSHINFSSENSERSDRKEMRHKLGTELSLDRFLSRYPNLTKLELSSSKHWPDTSFAPNFLVNSNTFKHLGRLKWLNLASNAKLMLPNGPERGNSSFGGSQLDDDHLSPFAASSSLEYLNLEWNGLKRFPLFSMLSPNFTIQMQKSNSTHHSSQQHCKGLPNLTSLNLAGNKLSSFENDLFTSFSIERLTSDRQKPALVTKEANSGNELNTCSTITTSTDGKKLHDTQATSAAVFLLPLLTQLDLSYNKLTGLSPKVGQYLLCTMPNLNQLYLQHNKIFHLNLNSLLTFPTVWPDSINSNNVPLRKNGAVSDPVRFSRLEYVDLSYNNLAKITALVQSQHRDATSVGSKSWPFVRVKSIDLSHNNLKRALTLFDVDLVNRIIFEESFIDPFALKNTRNGSYNNEQQYFNNFDDLEFNFLLHNNSLSQSICDFLSPSSKLQNKDDLLNEVILTSNSLNLIFKEDFSSQQCRDIQILRLSKNHISVIENEALFALHNLEILDLSHNLLNNLLENTFQRNYKLRVLDLSLNKLKTLHKNIFLHLTGLEELLLNGNALVTFPNDLIAHNHQIVTLDLSENRISHLDDAVFAHLKHLRYLSLHSNQLKLFTNQLFQLTKSIQSESQKDEKTIQAYSPKRKSPKSQTKSNNEKKFGNIKSKKRHNRQVVEESNTLILSFNQIEFFNFENCSSIAQNIQFLWLNNNLIKELRRFSLHCLHNIRKLNFRSNHLRSIDELTFSQLTQLDYIDLSQNELKKISPATLGFSGALNYIDLSVNLLNNIQLLDIFRSRRGFDGFAQVDKLDLSQNTDLKITTADIHNLLIHMAPKHVQFSHIEQVNGESNQSAVFKLQDKLYIEVVNISYIRRIDDQLFNLLSDPEIKIEKLDLSFMNISPGNSFELVTMLLMRLQSGLLELNISGNHYLNDQIMRLFNNLTFQVQLSVLDLTSNRLELWPLNRNTASMIPNLRTLDLSKNKLRYFIKNNSLDHRFNRLELLNLSSNALIGLVENPTNAAKSLKSLMPSMKQLDLSNNRLTWIPPQFFDELYELSLLKLDNNHLETLSAIYAGGKFVLDLSYNTKLKSITANKRESGQQVIEDEFDNLIIYDDHSSLAPQVICQPIHDYRMNYIGKSVVDFALIPEIRESNALQDSDDKVRADDEQCNYLLEKIDSVKLESISPHLNLHSISFNSEKYLHLNLRRNNLNQIITNERNKNIIQLDVSDNRIEEVSSSLCINLNELRSLDLSNNLISEYPSKVTSGCLKLSYMDLSFNKISSLRGLDSVEQVRSALMVLKLQHNMILSLNARELSSFKSLRFIDLRFNQLKYDQILPLIKRAQSLTVISDYKVLPHDLHQVKPQIGITNTSVFIDWRDSSGTNQLSLRVLDKDDKNNSTVHYQDISQVVKFCTLSAEHWTELCTKLPGEQILPEKCFHVRRPKNLPSCYTKLFEPLTPPLGKTYISPGDSSKLISLVGRDRNVSSESKIDEDPVLNMIDSLKRNWLKFKELDLNSYLVSISNIRSDSVWMQIDNKYPIYTLTVVKVAIVGGAICIIGLLIAMFTLLTYLSSNIANNTSSHLSPRSSSELTCMTSETDTSGSTNTNKSSVCNSATNTNSSLQTSNRTYSNTNSGSTSKEETQLQTVLERKATNNYQLDAGQLSQQQACSTPSSSLAPSSVETAETLQAIDSIQSGTSSIPQYNLVNKDSVDQYSDMSAANLCNDHLNSQVATVMRIVKSNSANFGSSNKPVGVNNSYATLNSRYQNQSTLRSKIHALQEHRRNQVYPSYTIQGTPTGYYSSAQLGYNYNMIPVDQCLTPTNEQDNTSTATQDNIAEQDLDPTTMSLLSLNTAISNSVKSSGSQQVSHAESKSISTGINDQHSNLCSYHRLTRDQQPLSDGEQLGSTGVILEQEEEHYPGNLILLSNLVPPPTTSRALEVLENQPSNFYHN